MADPGFGLKIHPATILRSLLQQYPSGGQFFLEALQNADDTGRAGKFAALLDLRQHTTQSLREPTAVRAALQGEAILFYDDAGFEKRDWRNLQFMCDSRKRDSVSEAGSFGMGSRSFFHITDILQVLSGSMLAALDPDDLLQTGHFGEQEDFTQQGFSERCPNEGAAFKGVFGCDMQTPFAGTIIRAALRTAERAKDCSFMPHAVDLERAQRIFNEFEAALKDGEVVLFLTSVTQVELWRWDPGAPASTLVARASLGTSSGHKLPRELSTPQQMRLFMCPIVKAFLRYVAGDTMN
jgi:sacsin